MITITTFFQNTKVKPLDVSLLKISPCNRNVPSQMGAYTIFILPSTYTAGQATTARLFSPFQLLVFPCCPEIPMPLLNQFSVQQLQGEALYHSTKSSACRSDQIAKPENHFPFPFIANSSLTEKGSHALNLKKALAGKQPCGYMLLFALMKCRSCTEA